MPQVDGSSTCRLPVFSLEVLSFLEMNYGLEPLRSICVPSIVQIYLSEMWDRFISPGRSRIVVALGAPLISRSVSGGRGVRVAAAGGQKRGRDVERVEVDRAMTAVGFKGPAIGRERSRGA